MKKSFTVRLALLMAVLVVGTGLFSTGCGSDLNPEDGWQVITFSPSVLHFQSQEDFLAVMEKLQEMDTEQKIE